MTSNYRFSRSMNQYGTKEKSKCWIYWLLIIGLIFFVTGVGLITLYYVDEPVLALVLNKFNIPYNEESTTEGNKYFPLKGLQDVSGSFLQTDGNYLPVKIVPKKGIFGKSLKDFELTPDAYLLLKEPIKATASKDFQPVLEGRLVLRSKKKSKEEPAPKNSLINSPDDIFPSESEIAHNSDSRDQDKHNQEKLAGKSDSTNSLTENTKLNLNIEEPDSDKIASDIAEEILTELDRKLTPETFLSEDGKSIITLPKEQENDENNEVIVTSTFFPMVTTEQESINERTEEESSTIPWTYFAEQDDFTNEDTKHETDSTLKPTMTKNVLKNKNKSMNNVEKSIVDFRRKFDSEKRKPVVMKVVKKFPKKSDTSYVTTEATTEYTDDFDNKATTNTEADNDLKETTLEVMTTVEPATTITSTSRPTTVPSTTTSTHNPKTVSHLTEKSLKKFKKTKKKYGSHPASVSKDLTDEDIEILTKFFDSVKNKRKSRSNQHKTVKRSYPESLLDKINLFPKLQLGTSLSLKTSTGTTSTTKEVEVIETTTTETVDSTTTTPFVEILTEEKTTEQTSPTLLSFDLFKNNYKKSDELENQNLLDAEMPVEESEPTFERETNKFQEIKNPTDDNLPHKRAVGNRLFPLVTAEKSNLLSDFTNKINKPSSSSKMSSNFVFGDSNQLKPNWLERLENEDSEERANRIEHELQKMIKFVGILSQLDGYFVQRTKAAAKKLVAILDDDEPQVTSNHHRRRRRNHYF